MLFITYLQKFLSKFFKKEPIAPQYFVRSSHRKVVYEIAALHLWSKTLKILFKDVYIQVSSTFQTNLGVTIHKKHQEELNRYVLFTTPIHHRNVMLTPYLIQLCSMRKLGLNLVSLYQEDFFLLFYLESGFLSLAYLSVSNLA